MIHADNRPIKILSMQDQSWIYIGLLLSFRSSERVREVIHGHLRMIRKWDAIHKGVEQREYQPKGGMCKTCTKRADNCSGLQFEAMPVIKVYSDGVKAVRCKNHTKMSQNLLKDAIQ